jgi:hypothetical protein
MLEIVGWIILAVGCIGGLLVGSFIVARLMGWR